MPWRRTTAAGVTVAAGSDLGAGDRWLIPGVLNDAYKVHLSEPGPDAVALHPAELLHTATLAGAQALDVDTIVGNFDVGKDADVVLVDVGAAPALARRLEGGAWPDDPDEADVALLFTLLLELSQEAITSVVVKGHEVESRPLSLLSGVLSIGRPG